MNDLTSTPTKQLDSLPETLRGRNSAATDLPTDVNTRHNIKTARVETLAKLYLDSEPAQIDDPTLVELCEWLWGEFQATPLNLEFSWYERYQNAAEMFADIKQSHLWVSAENYDTSLGINPIYNFILYAVHNHDHYRTHSDFSMEGELATYNATAKRAPSLIIQKIIYSESVLRPAAYLFLGHAPISKIVFP
ncbi:transposase [Chamaesiphon sp. VAR_69_metabat_338]|uniref:transposase n=1 Tax=Chamaesiphon sp. VAR_69_metabat_338 TaxID=2964704 RepID=UPI00286E4607|nr:transposase [Chamaesiphon sp. VAR_69_metabat_338]